MDYDINDELTAALIELDALTPAVPPLVPPDAKRAFENRRRVQALPEYARSIETSLALQGIRAPNTRVVNGAIELSCPFGCALYDVPNAVRIGPNASWLTDGADDDLAVQQYVTHVHQRHPEVIER